MSEQVEKFFPHFIEGLIKDSWNKKTCFFNRKIKFESYREGYFDAFKELDLLEYE